MPTKGKTVHACAYAHTVVVAGSGQAHFGELAHMHAQNIAFYAGERGIPPDSADLAELAATAARAPGVTRLPAWVFVNATARAAAYSAAQRVATPVSALCEWDPTPAPTATPTAVDAANNAADRSNS